MMYTSTYKGHEDDSDADELHITMPFKHNEEVSKAIHCGENFESDESFTMEPEEADRENAAALKT